jgi:hypothetical protein
MRTGLVWSQLPRVRNFSVGHIITIRNKKVPQAFPAGLSSGLTPELKFQFIHEGLDFWWSGRMSIGVMKYDGQNKRAAMLLERQPLNGQQDRRFSIHENPVMVIIRQTRGLFLRTYGGPL